MQDQLSENIKRLAEEIEPDLIRIRRKLHRYPEVGMSLPKTHDIICNELRKIPGLEIHEHVAGGSGIIGIMRGRKGDGAVVLLRADIDGLPIEEKVEMEFKSKHQGYMHACGHDGHAVWLIGAAKILASIRDCWGGCIKFVFQPGEEIGRGARELIEEDHVLENPKVDYAFAAHGWPSVESGKIGIARRYAFGSVGGFQIEITGRKGHASWPEQAIDPIAVANEIYQHIPSILSRKISGTEAKVMTVTYMQAGNIDIRNIIPQTCVFGGTIRAAKKCVVKMLGEELKKEAEAVCQVAGAKCQVNVETHGEGVKNSSELLEGVREAAARIIGNENVYIIEEDNLGGENFSLFSSRIPSVYMFIGIKPENDDWVPGLHSAEYQFDDNILKNAAGVFAVLACMGCEKSIDISYNKRV